jgi:type II secretion system protein N
MATDALDPNLVRSAKSTSKPGATAAPAQPKSRRKDLLKTLAYVLFFLWALAFFTMLKVPDSAITNFLLNSLNQNTPYQWQAERISLGFFPLPHLTLEKLNLEPKFGSGVPITLDEVRIYPNPFSLIPLGGPSAFGGTFRAEAYKAVVKGSFSSGSNLSLKIDTESVDLAKIKPLARSGVDLKGTLVNLHFQITMPSMQLTSSDGEVELKGKDMVLDPASFSLPIALPVLNLGDVNLQGQIQRGQVKIEKFKLGSAGKDLDMQVTGTITLADLTPNTRYDLHVLLKPSAAIKAVVPAIDSMLGTWATLKPDGYFAMRIQGTLSAPAFPTKD